MGLIPDVTSRYLLVRGGTREETYEQYAANKQTDGASDIPSVEIDPKHRLMVGGRAIVIPQPSYKIDQLLHARHAEFVDDDYDDGDRTGEGVHYPLNPPQTTDDCSLPVGDELPPHPQPGRISEHKALPALSFSTLIV